MTRPQLPDDLTARLADHDRRLAALERAPALASSAIRDGALVVYDAAGVARVKVGQDGSDYGVKVYDAAGANAVSLATLAFGITADQIDATGGRNDALNYGDCDDAANRPEVTVTVGPSGRMLVWFGATIMADTGENGYMTFQIDGGVTLGTSDARAARITGLGTAGGVSVSVSRMVAVTGLTAGAHVVTAKYKGAGPVNFQYRWLACQPY